MWNPVVFPCCTQYIAESPYSGSIRLLAPVRTRVFNSEECACNGRWTALGARDPLVAGPGAGRANKSLTAAPVMQRSSGPWKASTGAALPHRR